MSFAARPFMTKSGVPFFLIRVKILIRPTNNQFFFFVIWPYKFLCLPILNRRPTCPLPIYAVSSLQLFQSASSVSAVFFFPASVSKSVSVVSHVVLWVYPNHINCLSSISSITLCVTSIISLIILFVFLSLLDLPTTLPHKFNSVAFHISLTLHLSGHSSELYFTTLLSILWYIRFLLFVNLYISSYCLTLQ